MSAFQWTRKDLLSLYDLEAQEIEFILDTAAEFKKVSDRKVKKVPALRGKTVVNFFFEPSTRTRAFLIGKKVTVTKPTESYEALVTDITGKCELVLRLHSGKTEVLSTGEVSVKPV